jgi:hypothetical protein
VPRDGQVAQSTLVIGPRTGSAAAAKQVTDHRVNPGPPHKPKHGNCYRAGCSETDGTYGMPRAACPPGEDHYLPGCPEPIRKTARPAR